MTHKKRVATRKRGRGSDDLPEKYLKIQKGDTPGTAPLLNPPSRRALSPPNSRLFYHGQKHLDLVHHYRQAHLALMVAVVQAGQKNRKPSISDYSLLFQVL